MSKINYENVDADKLVIEEIKHGEIKDKNGNKKGEFTTMRTKYNIGTLESPLVRQCVMEWPIGTANNGIQEQISDDGRKSFNIRYVPDNMEQGELLLEKMVSFKQRVANAVYTNRVLIKNVKPTFKEESIRDNMKDIMYVPVNDFGERIPETSPSKFLNLDDGSFKMAFRTSFERVVGLDDNGQPIMEDIPWELLYGMRVQFVPLVSFYRVFSGAGGQSFQCKLKSALVISIEKPKKKNEHLETALKLMSDPAYLEKMNESYKLAKEMADARAKGMIDEDGNGNVVESGSGVISMPPEIIDPLAAVQAVNGIPSLPIAESLSDFVTPSMNSIPDLPKMPGMDM